MVTLRWLGETRKIPKRRNMINCGGRFILWIDWLIDCYTDRQVKTNPSFNQSINRPQRQLRHKIHSIRTMRVSKLHNPTPQVAKKTEIVNTVNTLRYCLRQKIGQSSGKTYGGIIAWKWTPSSKMGTKTTGEASKHRPNTMLSSEASPDTEESTIYRTNGENYRNAALNFGKQIKANLTTHQLFP